MMAAVQASRAPEVVRLSDCAEATDMASSRGTCTNCVTHTSYRVDMPVIGRKIIQGKGRGSVDRTLNSLAFCMTNNAGMPLIGKSREKFTASTVQLVGHTRSPANSCRGCREQCQCLIE